MLLLNERYDYKYCNSKTIINEYTIFADIVSEDENNFLLARSTEYGRFPLCKKWISKVDFYEQYQIVENAKCWMIRGNRFGTKVYLAENGVTQNLPDIKSFTSKMDAINKIKTLNFGEHWVVLPCRF